MNEILINTHIKENIDLLKARDVFFDKARKRYRWYELSVVIPPLVAGMTYIPMLVRRFPFINDYRDHIVGICTILFVVIGEIILKMNDEDLTVSNALREEYDLQVFGLPRNSFAISEDILKTTDGKWKDEIVKAWNSRKDTSKYEVWYQEVFSNDKRSNILCLQMDNIIYTYHIYNAYKKRMNLILFAELAGIIALFACTVFVWDNIQVFFLMMFSLFGALQYQISGMKTINEILSSIDHIYTYVRDDSGNIKEILADDDKGTLLLRSVQDVAIGIREKSLFVPKSIRNRYLKNGNEFYKQLDNIKQNYMADPYIPEKAEDIDILSDHGASITTDISKVHKRLFEMLRDIDRVFREEKIEYTLDGGSLIGACREEKGFVFWDDDVDIALMIDKVEDAKKAVRERLGDKYDVQDYDNDEAYSPRLSNFRIREKKGSLLVEKDSELHELYRCKGLFVDVYAYSPIICNKFIDKTVRRLLIQGFRFKLKDVSCLKGLYSKIKGSDNNNELCEMMEREIGFKGLYERIREAESDWKYKGSDEAAKRRYYDKFQRLKAKYLKRVRRYCEMAHNSEHYSYVPNYIDNLYIAGPYISRGALDRKTEEDFVFEGDVLKVPIPEGYDEVLTAFYGNWKRSPFVSLEELKREDGYEFSGKKFDATVLKHFKYINLF